MNAAVLGLIAVSVTQAGDTVVVHADQPPVWGADAALVEELRIGSLEGADEYVFGQIRGVAIGDGGSVYVADLQVPAIRQYGPDGSWIRNIGREGQGPGEYVYIYGITKLGDGPLTILDPRNARVTRYRDGEYDSSFPSLSGLFSADIFAADTAGRSYVKTVLTDLSSGAPRDPGAQWAMGWVRFDPEGEVVDTIPIPLDDAEGESFVLAGLGGYYRPFTAMTVSTFSPHGYMVSARNDRYALHRPLPDGRVLRIERRAERVAVKAEERTQWESWIEMFEERARTDGRATAFHAIPRSKPFIRHLFVDDDGRIWVAVYAEGRFKPYTDAEKEERGDRPSLEWNQPLVWEVFDPEGGFLGRVTLPDGTALVAARGSTVWGVQAGDFDEQYAVRFRLTGEGVR